jgi:hypothetical protein
MSNLAGVLSEQGKYEEAEKMHRDALGAQGDIVVGQDDDKSTWRHVPELPIGKPRSNAGPKPELDASNQRR